MSNNCVRCIGKKRTGNDLLCNDCREGKPIELKHPYRKDSNGRVLKWIGTFPDGEDKELVLYDPCL